MRWFILGGVVGLAIGFVLGAVLLPNTAGDVAPTKPARSESEAPAPPRPPLVAEGRTQDAPAAKPRSRPSTPDGTPTSELQAELEAAARKGGPAPNRGRRLQLVAGALHGRPAKLPTELLSLLLDHDDPFFRSTGAYLMFRAETPPWERLPALVADEDEGVRYCAALTAGSRTSHPDALRAYVLAFSDPEPRVRRAASRMAYRLVELRPSIRPALTAALRDPDRAVRRHAESCVEFLGEAGARHALRALARGRDPDRFIRAVVAGGLTSEALALDLTPEALTELASELLDLVEEGRVSLTDLSLPYPRLLNAAIRMDDDTGTRSVYALALRQGRWELVARSARDGQLTTEQRRRAVSMLLDTETDNERGLDVAAELILDGKTPQALRLELVHELGDSDLPDRARSILRRVAETDPDPDVREKARQELR